jgi:hypothetical protein
MHMNRMRIATSAAFGALIVIAGSLLGRGGPKPPVSGSEYRNSRFWRIFQRVTQAVDQRRGWDKLPIPLGLATIAGIRDVLRRENLYDTHKAPTVNEKPLAPFDQRYTTRRTNDGSYNDLADPAMGRAYHRFGRNVPLDRAWPEPEPAIMEPNPRTVSRKLLTREEFAPATSVNNLAGAWLQFMVHDWFSHGKADKTKPWKVPLEPGDPWPQDPMEIPSTVPDPTRPPGASDYPPTFLNTQSAWWDSSQLYGTTLKHQQAARTGKHGKLYVGSETRPPHSGENPDGNPKNEPGFWLGMHMLGEIFQMEHNAICDHLEAAYPEYDDEELFQRARLICGALQAKIHTMEWTPAIIAHPTMKIGMRVNWFGLAEERIHRLLGRISENEAISGIPGSPTAHYGVPYSLTEEFTAVYRMHPLLADDWSFRSSEDDSERRAATFREISGPAAVEVADQIGMQDLFYSFGTSHPGAIQLHNFPRFLQEFERPDGVMEDLAAVDVLRIREIGVPRYCEFRRWLHMPAPKTFEELTDNPEWAAQLREVYRDVERVDTMVGMFAETNPTGFAFSDTAFRVFILMASRRLNSDRFFTEDFTPEVYTKAGMQWIDDNEMTDVIMRHLPGLRAQMRGLDNAFAPWPKARAAQT